mmetsp:Transcript_8269/g.9621  ORF Transcript_8269/g.9621 Transcript_8269/m.9621 type:complete len:285 (+) Transcript_8269:1311-2165(+)
MGTENAASSSKKRSKIYKICAVMAPLAGKPQKIHIKSIKLRTKGTVTMSSTVLDKSSKVKGKSKKTSGWVATKGKAPAVVAKNPASCRKFNNDTAVVDPPSVFKRSRKAFHSRIAFGPSSPHCSDNKSSKACLSPMGNLQYPSGVQNPNPLYVSTGIVSSNVSKIIRNGFKLGLSNPSKMEGPTSNEYFSPLCTRVKVCAEPPTLICDSNTNTFDPYFADNAPQVNPPIPDPITITSYSSVPSVLPPDIPFPVPGYVGFSYFCSVDISYENVMTFSREVSSVWA